MQNIWLISHNLDGVMAGPSIRFQRYAPIFMKEGYRLCFITYSIDPTLPKHEKKEHFDIHRIWIRFKPFSRTRFITKAIQLIIQKGGKSSFVLSFGIQTYQLWMIPILNLLKIKFFYINTMLVTNEFKTKSFVGNIWNTFHTLLYRIVYNNISGVVTSTSMLADAFDVFSLKTEQKNIINNGVDINRFVPLNAEQKVVARNSMGYKRDELLFLFVGLKTERKGIKELVESWIQLHQQYPKSKLLLVGDEKEESNNAIFQTWWSEMLKSDILLNNKIYNLPGSSKIDQWFKIADVFVFPSKKEGMPNVVLEAMACGLPLIMNKFEGYSSDYGLDGLTHTTTDITESQNLLNALILLHDAQKRNDIGDEARRHISQNFSIESSVSKYIDLT